MPRILLPATAATIMITIFAGAASAATGLLAPTGLGVNSALQLDGATVCLTTGTPNELALANYFQANNMKYEPILFDSESEGIEMYGLGNCDVLVGDKTTLESQRLKLADPAAHLVLPESID